MITCKELLASSEFIATHHLDSTCSTYCNACRMEMTYAGGLTLPARAPCAGFALPASLVIERDSVRMCIESSVTGTGSAMSCAGSLEQIVTRPREWSLGRDLFHAPT